jgi:polysaccharide pyruvyl transferase CsaB
MADSTAARACRVVIAGWYGATNLGDELLLTTIVGWVRAMGGTPTVISVNPAFTRAALGVEAVGFSDLAAIVEGMADADLFVLGGGGLFQDYDRLDTESLARFPALNATQYAQQFHLARELGLSTLALAQGVGPLRGPGAKVVVHDVFRLADDVSVRDVESADLLRDIGVDRELSVAPDPGWAGAKEIAAIDLRSMFPQFAGKRILGINLRRWPFDSAWEDQFVRAFHGALPPGWVCLWVDFQRTPNPTGAGFLDDEIASRMIERVKDDGTHVRFDGIGMADTLGALAACDAVLAMRLHAVLVGHGAGRPVVALEYDGKVGALGASLDVPVSQRLALPEIPLRMREALAAVTAPDRNAFVVSRQSFLHLADAALAHRELLWKSMAAATAAPRARPATMPPLLAQWLNAQPDALPRVTAALAQRRQAAFLVTGEG